MQCSMYLALSSFELHSRTGVSCGNQHADGEPSKISVLHFCCLFLIICARCVFVDLAIFTALSQSFGFLKLIGVIEGVCVSSKTMFDPLCMVALLV